LLAGTGLRINEVRLLTVADCRLDASTPHLRLSAAITKNGKADTLPLRADLVALLRPRVEGRRPADPVFDVTADLIKRFHADCRRAKIDRYNGDGDQVDLHSLRLTFGSYLAAAGVPLTTAQKLMRHSDPKLTANVYTDPRLLDLAGAVEAIPSVAPTPSVAPSVALSVALPTGIPGHSEAPPVTKRRKPKAS
jgi:integrase